MENKSIIDYMKIEQIKYNLKMAGVKNYPEPYMSIYEEWAEKIFEENKELFANKSKEEFIKYVIYGEL